MVFFTEIEAWCGLKADSRAASALVHSIVFRPMVFFAEIEAWCGLKADSRAVSALVHSIVF